MARTEDSNAPNALSRLWQWFWRPSTRFAWGGLLVGGVIAGIIAWGGFHTVLEATNTQAFCTSCHEMNAFVLPEYEASPHYRNVSGVRATCPDCHVPREWGPKLARKVRATNELYHKALGTINTREKFEAMRLTLAGNVWRTMKATDSRECRNCHSIAAMNIEGQVKRAQRLHAEAAANKDTCIDCHQGIAHTLPEGWEAHYERAISD
jgi:nitrate/TMAO reductase-like tetraheme cytochrome c subunit